MVVTTDAVGARRLWGTFDDVSDGLFAQFRDVHYAQDRGIPLEDLEAEVEEYLAVHADQSKVLQKANVYRLVVTRGQIGVDPNDWFADKLNHGHILRKLTKGSFYAEKLDRGTWLDEAAAGPLAEGTAWFDQARDIGMSSTPKAGVDLGHISPGWENMFSGGLLGLIDQAHRAKDALGDQATQEQLDFYEAVEIVYNASIAFANRMADLAEDMAASDLGNAERLAQVASSLRRVPAHAPETFHQVLQFTWLMHELIEMEGEDVRSMGQFDRILYPYYRADIESGRLNKEQAKELIKFYWFKWYSRTQGAENGKNFVFGGQAADGSILENDLTYVALEAFDELCVPDPKLSVRYLPEHSDKLYERVADMVRRGRNSFVLMNDAVAVEALVKRGKPVEDARTYLPIGCYEPAVDGKEAACTMNTTVNLAKPVELALNDGVDPLSGKQIGPHTGDPRQFETFDQVMNAYLEQLDFILTTTSKYIADGEQHWPDINPSPLIGGTIDDCLARGKDVGQGGPVYNTVGFVGAGLANAADSLASLKQTVFETEQFSFGEVLDAISVDFEGHENMRQHLLNRVPKWGTNNSEVDGIARQVADHFSDKVHSFTNGRGGGSQAALFTLTFALAGGKGTGALPDGRKARESLAPGVGASYGQDRKGVTALIDSVSKLDFTQTPNGSVLDVTLHPTAIAGEEGLQAFVGLIKTFFEEGGYAIQFNVFDVETLRDAQRHPEKYASLQIRVTGWSVYFTTLSREAQDQFIGRLAHGA
ncbi:MAG: hypothetical protein FI707_12545 [SAR202 cluster bacterium]|nr:hypothetical protein [Chloroflexota bacterium]MDP6422663.1 pyruvate formate lyase family protein [SAR202 cluster bacterium]HAL48110.1 hypothetical protein [Dehalococcoidia bacterium]MDP6663517.1 pyruvate formate lyase family protein [SAR202 cluster bacterium]MDP6801024.1 pyruvate formate lyase family protein [SAR202 cluster bacterium]